VQVSTKGLVGGDPVMRARRRRVPAIEHALFLNPIDFDEDARRVARFVWGHPVAVEIGFGKGGFLTEFSRMNPGTHVVGFEVRRRYCFEALARLEGAGVDNARILLGDGRSLMARFFPPCSIDILFILFPDPWWKKKHHKRRVLNAEFFRAAIHLLRPGARVVVRSDVPMVIELGRQALCEAGGFAELDHPGTDLPLTDRESVCRELGIECGQVVFAVVPGVEG